jgi:hypothetical protein
MKEFMINYMLLLLTLRMVLALPTPVPTPAPTPAPEPEPLPGHFNSPTYAITHLAFHKMSSTIARLFNGYVVVLV